jgi:hypothetical protein
MTYRGADRMLRAPFGDVQGEKVETGNSKLENRQSPIVNHQWLDDPMSQ